MQLIMKDHSGRYASRIRTLWFKTFFVLFIASVMIWLFISFAAAVDKTTMYDIDRQKFSNPAVAPATENRTEEITKESVKNEKSVNTTPWPVLNVDEIKRRIAAINRKEEVYNEDKFGPLQSDGLVIVVQVHSRLHYLRHLITSLSAAKGISTVLLIFSHDFYDEEINSLIKTIDFCKVMQIFYSYSMQTYPNEFPGKDPHDCPPNVSRDEAVKSLCKNALNPDNGGKYRTASSVQVKHHWWWKANRVFNLAAVRSYNGLVLFLEEDLYLVEDFVPALKLMEVTARAECDYCKILSLANNGDATHFKQTNFNRADKAIVVSQFSNMGLAFNRATWAEIVDCRREFCTYDDYNWDFSLQHVFTTCMENAAAMTLSTPRIFHLGSCGVHFQSKNCDSSKTVTQIQQMLADPKAREHLYPARIGLQFLLDHRKITGGYGGWGDPRDHAFCLGMTVR